MRQVAARDEDEAFVADLRVAVDCLREPAPRIREATAESVDAPAADGREGDRLGVARPLGGRRRRGQASDRGFMVAALDLPLRQPRLDERDDDHAPIASARRTASCDHSATPSTSPVKMVVIDIATSASAEGLRVDPPGRAISRPSRAQGRPIDALPAIHDAFAAAASVRATSIARSASAAGSGGRIESGHVGSPAQVVEPFG